MFSSLKNKIKEETGADVAEHQRVNNNNRLRSRFSSTISINSNGEELGGLHGGVSEQQHSFMSNQLSTLRSQCNDLTTKVAELTSRLQALQEEKLRIEKTNEILLETVKVAQTQKDMYCEEQEKIQNIQQSEIDKLKSLLSFREQEAVDRLAAMRQAQHQVENLTAELERLKQYEHMVEDVQDELEQFRHSAQQGKNNLTTTLAAVEEENRHLKMRLQIVEQARLDALSTLNASEKLQALVQERKLLEQHLEEAHLQLSDIKSSWSGQNLALETQVSRLSKQVAEETTEKRKAITARDDLHEKVKQREFEILNLKDEIKQRDDKINLLEEEIDEVNSNLKSCREDREQKILFERNKVATLETDSGVLKSRLSAADERFSEYAANAESIAKTLRQQQAQQQKELNELQNQLELERDEKLTALLRNAEISQSEELLKKELRIEREETNELQEKLDETQTEMKSKEQELITLKTTITDLQNAAQSNAVKLQEVDALQREICEKNKTIKILNQRLADLKKTLQKEFRNTPAYEALTAQENAKQQQQQHTTANGHVMKGRSGSIETTTAAAATTLRSKSLTCNCGAAYIAVNDATTTSSDAGACAIVMDEVNFKYLKHVIVKFLTSREVEARHLIRAVATLLKLSKEEEQLLHDTLNWKMSWFGAKPNHGKGQHAFAIPPS